MRVEIDFEQHDPPSGSVIAGGPPLAFAGWLALLRILEDLTAGGARDETPGDGSKPVRGPADPAL